MDDLATLDATAQAELVRRGLVSPPELVGAAIERIERVDGELNAVIHRRFERARSEAGADLAPGPFRGVPVVVKDLGAGQVDGEPHHRGNRGLREARWIQRGDSALVSRLRHAGFVVVGKTNTPELGFASTTEPEAYGPTRNPWDPARTPAGSSGGSAAAVAAGLVPVAHATDGGGSIRMPAAACGLVGLKPSRGRVSTAPFIGESGGGRSVDFAVARSVRDAAAMLDVLAGPAPGDPVVAPPPARPYAAEVGADPGRLRVGILDRSPLDGAPAYPDARRALRDVASVLASGGHAVEEEWPQALAEPEVGLAGILPVHAATIAAAVDQIGRQLGRAVGPEDFEPSTWAQAELGRGFSAPQLVTAREVVVAWSRRVTGWWAGGFDLLLLPTLGTAPPALGAMRWDGGRDRAEVMATVVAFGAYCPAFNWTGQPAITLPVGTDADGMPVGVQLVAAYGREDLLLRVAARVEEARPWSGRRPRVHA